MASPLEITLPPGYVKTDSPLAATGRYVDGDNVRFYRDRPQKVGGSVLFIPNALDTAPIRGMWTWNAGNARQLLAAGTANAAYVVQSDSDQPTDITPVGVPKGNVSPVRGYGFGVGPYGKQAYGTGRVDSQGNPSSPFLYDPRTWSFANFGSILLLSANNYTLYYWNPSASPEVRARPVSGAPDQIQGFWQTAERFTICFGCTGPNGEPQNLMRVSWSAQGDYTDWRTVLQPADLALLPGAPAGSRTLQFGQKIIGAVDLGNQTSLIWTDAALYTWQYVGSSFTFDSQIAGERCGLLARYAFAIVADTAYWMSNGNFWMYGSNGVSLIPKSEDISEWFFGQLDEFQASKTFAFYNVRFSEVWFVIPTANDSIEPILAAVYNVAGEFWFHCRVSRTAATAFSVLDPAPVLGGADSFVYQHETSLNAAGSAMPWSLTTGYLEISDGGVTYDIYGMMPDMERQVGRIVATINALDRTPTPAIDGETEAFDPTAGIVDYRIAGREMQLSLSCGEIDCDFRLGAPKIEFQAGGSRR